MIKNDSEFNVYNEQYQTGRDALDKQIEKLKEMNLSDHDIKTITTPIENALIDMNCELQIYENLKAGDLKALNDLSPNVQLIGLRIAKEITQSELARRLGVSPAQVSKDEKNEYHGISLEKYIRILDALEVGEVCSFILDNTKVGELKKMIQTQIDNLDIKCAHTVLSKIAQTNKEMAAC